MSAQNNRVCQRRRDLQVSQPAHEVQNVAQVGLGISVAAGRLGEAQLLGDGVELQRTDRENVPILEQLLPCNKHATATLKAAGKYPQG